MKGFWKRFAIAYALILAMIAGAFILYRHRQPASERQSEGSVLAASTRAPAQVSPPRASATPRGRQPLPAIEDSDYDRLAARHLTFPAPGARTEGLVDTFAESRGAHQHEALDIIADMGTPVIAVEDGTIAKLFTSKGGGGLTIYQFDPSKEYCYYYAHLSGYVPGLKEGATVRRGDRIGYVGMTGNARTPHLHFAIFKLSPEKLWWRGTALNPYPILRGTPATQRSASSSPKG